MALRADKGYGFGQVDLSTDLAEADRRAEAADLGNSVEAMVVASRKHLFGGLDQTDKAALIPFVSRTDLDQNIDLTVPNDDGTYPLWMSGAEPLRVSIVSRDGNVLQRGVELTVCNVVSAFSQTGSLGDVPPSVRVVLEQPTTAFRLKRGFASLSDRMSQSGLARVADGSLNVMSKILVAQNNRDVTQDQGFSMRPMPSEDAQTVEDLFYGRSAEEWQTDAGHVFTPNASNLKGPQLIHVEGKALLFPGDRFADFFRARYAGAASAMVNGVIPVNIDDIRELLSAGVRPVAGLGNKHEAANSFVFEREALKSRRSITPPAVLVPLPGTRLNIKAASVLPDDFEVRVLLAEMLGRKTSESTGWVSSRAEELGFSEQPEEEAPVQGGGLFVRIRRFFGGGR